MNESATASARYALRICAMCLWCLLMHVAMPLRAQLPLLVQESMPAKIAVDQMALQTSTGVLWYRSGRSLSPVASDIDFVDSCNHHFIFHFRGANSRQVMVVPAAQPSMQFRVDDFVCSDSLFFGFSLTSYYCYANGGDLGRSIYCSGRGLDAQKVQEKLAWTVPLPAASNPYDVSCAAMRSWGILSDGGIWLIPPDYDAPITFEDGIAVVSRYGQRYKINETGERVE